MPICVFRIDFQDNTLKYRFLNIAFRLKTDRNNYVTFQKQLYKKAVFYVLAISNENYTATSLYYTIIIQ